MIIMYDEGKSIRMMHMAMTDRTGPWNRYIKVLTQGVDAERKRKIRPADRNSIKIGKRKKKKGANMLR
jgi:hypothetical protein